MSTSHIMQRFTSLVPGVIRLANQTFFAHGRDDVGVPCTFDREGAQRWRRGGSGSASTLETCLKTSSDTYAWAVVGTGGTAGLAAHELDTTTHGATGAIVGTTNTQTLTNKTLTSPIITTPTISSPTGLVKGDVGLGNVDNTSDATKNAAAVTLTNKTLTAPVIADFTNMAHDHLDADDGGTLSAAAIASGTIATARLGAGTADSSMFLRGDQTWSDLPLVPGVWNAFYTGEFGTNGTGNGEFDVAIRGIAVNPDTGDVYVSSDDRVQKFTANGTYSSTLATAGSGNGQVDTPWGMEYRPTSNSLYIVDSGNGRIQRFASDAWAENTTADYTGEGARGLDFATAMWGTLAGTDEFVLGFDTDAGRFGSTGTGPLEFDTPNGITAQSGAGSLVYVWIVDARNHRVQAISIEGFLTPSLRFTIGSFGSSSGQFDTPDSIALDNHGNIYVTDSGNHRVQVFNDVGIFQGSFGTFGTGNAEFDTPTGIAITDDYIYVCDSGNFRVQIFTNPVARRAEPLRIDFWAATPGVDQAWSNMPATETSWRGFSPDRFTAYVNLSGISEARLGALVFVAGSTGSQLRVQYSTNNGSSWSAMAVSGTLNVPITSTGPHVGTWTTVPPAARGEVLLRVTGAGGNSTADPNVFNAYMEAR